MASIKDAKNRFLRGKTLGITGKEVQVCLTKVRRVIGKVGKGHVGVQKDPGNMDHIEERGNW